MHLEKTKLLPFGAKKSNKMKSLNNCFPYQEYDSIDELTTSDRELVLRSYKATEKAYAPYSNFKVGAAFRLANTIVVDGSNQENAASPEGLCAERVALYAAAHRFPKVAGDTLAITASLNGKMTNEPVSPCGGCRQVIAEYVQRHNKTMRLILTGKNKIIVIEDAMFLLPLSFSSNNLG